MTLLIILFIIYLIGWKFEVRFDYLKQENLFLIFYTAKNTRKTIKIKL